MKSLLVVAALAAVGYAIFKLARSGAFPQGTLSRAAEAPGIAVSKLGFSAGNPAAILAVIAGAVLLLLLMFTLARK